MDKTAIAISSLRCKFVEMQSCHPYNIFFFYFVTMTIIIKWTNWHLLTCGCFPPQQYGYTDSPYSTGQGSILSQLQAYLIRSSCIDFMSWSHWLDDSRLWLVSRHPVSPPTVSIRQSPPALYTELHSPGLHFQLWVLYLPLDVLSLTWVHQEISSWPRLWESFAPEVKLCVIIYRLDYTVVVID